MPAPQLRIPEDADYAWQDGICLKSFLASA